MDDVGDLISWMTIERNNFELCSWSLSLSDTVFSFFWMD